jgi:hypothetical protein
MNDGLRIVIERRGDDLYYTVTNRGVEHNGKSHGLSFEDCGREINQYLRFQKLGDHFAKQRAARAAGG